jgi:exonuclease VII large subunit
LSYIKKLWLDKYPHKYYESNKNKLIELKNKISYLHEKNINSKLNHLNMLKQQYESGHPKKLLSNGYSILMDNNNIIIKNQSQLNNNDTIKIFLADSIITVSIKIDNITTY